MLFLQFVMMVFTELPFFVTLLFVGHFSDSTQLNAARELDLLNTSNKNALSLLATSFFLFSVYMFASAYVSLGFNQREVLGNSVRLCFHHYYFNG